MNVDRLRMYGLDRLIIYWQADLAMDLRRSWGGRVVLAPGLVLYLGVGSSADRHAHHAVQFVWVAEGQLDIAFASETMTASAALVTARVPHAFSASGQPLALLLVDGHGSRGVALDRRARELAGEDLSRHLSGVPFPSRGFSLEDAERWVRTVLAALGVESTEVQAPSRTTRRAIAYIEQALDGVPRIADAAAFASTSPSRLSHRFSQEIGLPFRRFVLWTRMKRAVEIARGGGDLAAAAAAAGFSDAAHFSRTFRAMFGLSPSVVLPFVELAGKPWTDTSPLAKRARPE